MKYNLALLFTIAVIVACTPAAVVPPTPDACADAAPLDKKKCPPCPVCGDASPAPAPAPTGVPEAGPAPVNGYAAVCQHLGALGCPEGANPSCATLIGKVQDAALGDLKPACLLAAQTATAVQACGTVRCSATAKARH
jgi:hypothetical protein